MGEAKRKGLNVSVRRVSKANYVIPVSLRSPLHEELEWWAVESDRVIGTVILDRADNDYSWVALTEHADGFRGADFGHSHPTIDEARQELHAVMRKLSAQPARSGLTHLSWQFETSLAAEQGRLIAALKPHVVAWSRASYPAAKRRLSEALDGSQATVITEIMPREGVWLFVAMIHNRDLGTDTVAMAAPTREKIEKMTDAFHVATEMRMGAPADIRKQ
jgi:hypothetical protein